MIYRPGLLTGIGGSVIFSSRRGRSERGDGSENQDFTVSVARGLVISGVLIMVLPTLVGAASLWFAMPVTELLTALYTAAAIRRYTGALPD